MAIYHVTGGGSALNTALRNSAVTNNSIFYVHPGIYTPYNVTTKSGLSVIGIGESRSDVVIRGLYWDGSEQKKSTAIAGTHIDVLSNMTLSGFTRTNLSIADIGYEQPAKTLRDCDIFDCKTILSSDPGIKGDLFHQTAFYNCHISGCTTGSYFFYGSVVQDCELNHNTMQYYSNAGTFFSSNDVRRNYAHDNFLRGYMQVNVQSYANIYENNNLNSHSFSNSNGIFANCLFIGNKNLNNFGYGCQYKNCVFVQNTTTETAGNLYRPNITGTSAQTQLRINNFYDVPLTSINNMQALINNSQVSGKYALAEDNHFGVQLADLGFIDSENHDYRLKSDSVLISAGTTRSDFTVRYGSKYFPSSSQLDIDGRRFKNPPSVGPYQYYKKIEGEIPNYINPIGQRERAPWSEIEYLESTGTQWIDTEIIPMSSTIWNLDFAFTTVDVNNGCGCAARQNTGGGMTIRQRANGATMLYRKSDSISNRDTTIASNTSRHTMQMQASHAGIYLDGAWRDTTYGTAAWLTTGNTVTLKLFGFYEKIGTIDAIFLSHMRIYSSSMSNENGHVFDLVPFRVGNVGYLFDKVTKKLFKNQGTGAFILGPDKN